MISIPHFVYYYYIYKYQLNSLKYDDIKVNTVKILQMITGVIEMLNHYNTKEPTLPANVLHKFQQ